MDKERQQSCFGSYPTISHSARAENDCLTCPVLEECSSDQAQEDTPANDIVDGLCRRMLSYAIMGAGGKTDQMRASDIKRALAVFFTDEEIARAIKEICGG